MLYFDEFIKGLDFCKDDVLGYVYFFKIKYFIDMYYIIGELFFEYRKGSCVNSFEGKL